MFESVIKGEKLFSEIKEKNFAFLSFVEITSEGSLIIKNLCFYRYDLMKNCNVFMVCRR
jgi:hypothetical protein